jgi:hypothetical protein
LSAMRSASGTPRRRIPTRYKIAGAVILFNDLRSKASKRAIDSRAVHDPCFFDKIHFAGYYKKHWTVTS